MNASASLPLAADLCGMFVVDAGGKIVAANASVRAFFGNTGRRFTGESLPGLFASGAVPPDAEEADARWRAFKTASLDRWTTYRVRSAGGGSNEVRVRLERSVGGAGSFIATLRPAVAAS